MARKHLSTLAAPPDRRLRGENLEPSYPKDGTLYPKAPTRSEIGAQVYLAEHGAFPEPNRSSINRARGPGRTQRDLGWARGVLHDGAHDRPFLMEVWSDEGHITMLTLFFSRIGLEDLDADTLATLLSDQGILEWAERVGYQLIRADDDSQHPVWSFNACVGANKKLYITRSPSYTSWQ